jgi:hypothetical protein
MSGVGQSSTSRSYPSRKTSLSWGSTGGEAPPPRPFPVQKTFPDPGGDGRRTFLPDFGPKKFSKGGPFRAGGGRGVVGGKAEGAYLGPGVGNLLSEGFEGISLGLFLGGESLDYEVTSGILETVGDPPAVFEDNKFLEGGVQIKKAVNAGFGWGKGPCEGGPGGGKGGGKECCW